MTRRIFEPGDRVQWPNTQVPASGDSERALTVVTMDATRYRKTGKYYVRYLFKELMDRVVEDMHSNIAQHFDNLVVVCGDEGTGKSNLAYHLCRTFDPEFDLEKSYAYTWDDFIEKLTNGDPQRVYWLDEAINLASGRDWMKEANKMLIRVLQTMRSKGMTLVMCVPVLKNLDVYIRTHRTRYLFVADCMRWPDIDSE